MCVYDRGRRQLCPLSHLSSLGFWGLRSGHRACVISTVTRRNTLLAYRSWILKLFLRLFKAMLHFNSGQQTILSRFVICRRGLKKKIKPSNKGKMKRASPRVCSLRVREVWGAERFRLSSGQFVAQQRLWKDGHGSPCLQSQQTEGRREDCPVSETSLGYVISCGPA